MQSNGKIKIGFISCLTGHHAELVKNQEMGVRLAVEEINASGGLLGRELELLTRDDETNPEKAAAHARDLIYNEKVDALIGTLSAATVMEVNREAINGNVFLLAICQAKLVTDSAHLGPFTFHEALTPRITTQLITRWGMEHLGKRWYLLAYDFQYGDECMATFKELIPGMGGEIVGTTMVPLHTPSEAYEPIFKEILAARPDILSVTNLGPDQVNFFRAAHKAGILRDMSVINTLSDLFIVDNISLEELVGMYWGVNFYWDLKDQSASTKKFVESFTKRFNTRPSGYAGYGYSGIMELAAAITGTGKYPLDNAAMVDFLEGRSYDHYKGRQWWRPCDHQSFQSLYMMRFKGPQESTERYDIGEIVDKVEWDLDIEETCEHLGHSLHLGGVGKRGHSGEFQG